MPIYKIQAGRIITVESYEWVGDKGTIWYDETLGDLRIGDGVTPGGRLLQFGGAGSGPTIIGSVANSSLLDPSYTGAVGHGFIAGDTGDLWVWNGATWTNIGRIQGPAGYTGSQGNIGFTGYTGSAGSFGDTGYTGSFGNVGFTGSFGDTGYTGSFGDTGYTGSFGDTGYTGSQGAGFTGSQGDVGFSGSVGYTGSQGNVGFTGSVGDVGFTGSVGYTGSQGNTGMGFQIAKIYLSVADLTADINPSGILVGEFAVIETGNNNDPENSRLYLWDGTSYSYVTDLSGAVGLTGIKGDIGYTGSAGINGSVGYTGSFGDTGYTGSFGDTGYTGSAGINGSVGYTGSAGINGSVGYTGSFGDTGYTGSIGFTGSAVPGMVSDGNGTITIASGYNIVPATDGLQSLGSATAAWGELYVSGNTIYLGNNVISINADGSLDITNSAGDAIPVRAKNFIMGGQSMPAHTQGTNITGVVFPDGSLQTTSAPKMYTNADAANGLNLSDLKPGDFYYDDVNAAIFICYDTGLGYFDILDLTVRAS